MISINRIALGAAVAVALYPLAATADDTTYPPGTECANLRTIAERLLCGRQEFRRGDSSVQEQMNVPAPPYDGYISGDDATPAPAGTATVPPSPAAAPSNAQPPAVTPE